MFQLRFAINNLYTAIERLPAPAPEEPVLPVVLYNH